MTKPRLSHAWPLTLKGGSDCVMITDKMGRKRFAEMLPRHPIGYRVTKYRPLIALRRSEKPLKALNSSNSTHLEEYNHVQFKQSTRCRCKRHQYQTC